MEKENLQNNFIRQRRNLIGISLVLFFYQSSGIVMNTITILGNTLNISAPSRIYYLLWIAWGYFLLRYYQYLRNISKLPLKEVFDSKMQQYVPVAAFKFFKSKMFDPEKDAHDLEPPYKFFLNNNIFIKRQGPKEWQLDLAITVYSEKKSQYISTGATHTILVDSFLLTRQKIKSAFYVALNTRFVTEYYLPFLIAAIPLCYQIFLLCLVWTYKAK